MALDGKGRALARLGQVDEAAAVLTSAARAFEHAGDRRHEGESLAFLGTALRRAGRVEAAVPAFEQAVAAYRAAGDAGRAGQALDALNACRAVPASRPLAITRPQPALSGPRGSQLHRDQAP